DYTRWALWGRTCGKARNEFERGFLTHARMPRTAQSETPLAIDPAERPVDASYYNGRSASSTGIARTVTEGVNPWSGWCDRIPYFAPSWRVVGSLSTRLSSCAPWRARCVQGICPHVDVPIFPRTSHEGANGRMISGKHLVS